MWMVLRWIIGGLFSPLTFLVTGLLRVALRV